MVLPFILAGAVLAAGGIGIGKGARAVDRISRARTLSEHARARYKVQKQRLTNAREACQEALTALGRCKLQVMDTTMRRFCSSIGHLQGIQLRDVPSMATVPQAELEALPVRSLDVEAIDALKLLVASGAVDATAELVRYGAVGTLRTARCSTASTRPSGDGASTNTTLAWLGGGVLVAPDPGIAGGAWLLGSIVPVSVLAIGGMGLSARFKDPLAKDRAQPDELARAIEQMTTVEAAAAVIKTHAEQISQVLHDVRHELQLVLPQLEAIVSREPDWRRLQSEQKQALAAITSLVHLVNQVIESPLFDDEGYPVDDTATRLKRLQLCRQNHQLPLDRSDP